MIRRGAGKTRSPRPQPETIAAFFFSRLPPVFSGFSPFTPRSVQSVAIGPVRKKVMVIVDSLKTQPENKP
jgi:hypothetical protein